MSYSKILSLSILICFSFVCGKSNAAASELEKNERKLLIGTWNRHMDQATYRADGTFLIVDKWSKKEAGKWRIQGKFLVESKRHEEPYKLEILSVSKTELHMAYPSGDPGIDYERVTE